MGKCPENANQLRRWVMSVLQSFSGWLSKGSGFWQKTKVLWVAKIFSVVDDVRQTWERRGDERQHTDKANNGCCWQSGHLCGHRFAVFPIVHSFIVWNKCRKYSNLLFAGEHCSHLQCSGNFHKNCSSRREMRTFVSHFQFCTFGINFELLPLTGASSTSLISIDTSAVFAWRHRVSKAISRTVSELSRMWHSQASVDVRERQTASLFGVDRWQESQTHSIILLRRSFACKRVESWRKFYGNSIQFVWSTTTFYWLRWKKEKVPTWKNVNFTCRSPKREIYFTKVMIPA